MNYGELKSIIVHIKKNFACPDCGKKFTDREINVIGTLPDMVFLHFCCEKCEHNSIIQVSIIRNPEEEPQFISEEISPEGIITHDEVLDMHNFLKEFKGDLKEYMF